MTTRPAALAAPLAAGAAVALFLGIYAAAHEPTGRDFVLAGFSGAGAWKSALASLTAILFVVQVSLGLRIAGRVGPRQAPPPWAHDIHRLVGTVAFGFSLPVVFHCLWVLGYRGDDARVAIHGVLGCAAYGLYVVQVLSPTIDERPHRSSPVVGSLLGLCVLGVWWTSAYVHFTGGGA